MRKLLAISFIIVMSLLFGCGGGGGGSSGSSNGSTVNNSADTGTGGSTGSTTDAAGGTGASGGTGGSTAGADGGGTGDGTAGADGGGTGDTAGNPPPPVVIIPGAPTDITVKPGNGQVAVSWSSVANATSYNVYWSTTGGVAPSQASRQTGAVSPCVITGLVNGTAYHFVVTAVNQYGESALSSEVSATPAAYFVAEMVSGKSFDYTFSTGATGVVSFNSDGTFTGENLSVGMPLTGQWGIEDGVLKCVYPGGITETIVLNSSTSTSFMVTYSVSYADGSTSSSVEGTFNMK